MIRHICMFTLKEDNKEKNIIEFFTVIPSNRRTSDLYGGSLLFE